MTATPTAAKNRDRTMKKIMAILFQPDYAGSARTHTDPVGRATVNKTKRRVFVCTDVPAAGENVAAGDICLDTTNNDVYRYYDSAWDKLNVTT